MKAKITRKSFTFPVIFLVLFYSIAVWRFIKTGNVFYIYNFGYIGTVLAAGFFLTDVLPKERFGTARRITQLLIGSYLLLYVGLYRHENLQIEGFWFYLFSGIFAGSTLHYFIAKIAGPFIFNRGWCGWACWTGMILDFFPWKTTKNNYKRASFIRYVYFIIIFIFSVIVYFILKEKKEADEGMVEFYFFIFGNLLYYAAGIVLALILKDNRAFCKYICPISVFMKIGAKYSLLKLEINPEKCITCRKCEINCPMNIKLLEYKNRGERIQSTECIFCNTCTTGCPTKAITGSFKVDGILPKK
ncbi:MAG TPA: 4Fe-4S ferredoxin [Treponema sp.]|nr:4Fe-4S ferredoxin [Treponema sp.]